MASSDKNEDVKNQLKDLLHHLTPWICNEESSESSIDLLQHLSEVHPNFHKINFVKFLRTNLRDSLSGEVEKSVNLYLDSHKGKIKNESSVEDICQILFKEKAYIDFESGLEDSLRHSTADLIKEFDENGFEDFISKSIERAQSKNVSPHSHESSLSSSLNQSGFLFINPSEYEIILENLTMKPTSESVHNALNMLLAVTPGEIVSQTLWSKLRKSLKEILQSDIDGFFYKSLRFHSRLIGSQIHLDVKEGCLNIIEALSGLWISKKLHQNLPNKNSVLILEGNKVLILTRVLVTFLRDYPLVSIRYSSQYISEIIEAFLQIFAIKCSHIKEEKLSFFDILCFIDPKALWFRSWTHSSHIKKILFDTLQGEPALLLCSINWIFFYVEQQKACNLKTPSSGTINTQDFDFLKFHFSVSIVFSIMQHAYGRALFPLYDHKRMLNYSMKKILHALSSTVKISNQYLTVKIIMLKFSDICEASESSCKLLCEYGIVDYFIDVLRKSCEFLVSGEKDLCFMPVIEFLIKVSHSACGNEFLITGKSRRSSKSYLIKNAETPAQKILEVLHSLFLKEIELTTRMFYSGFLLIASILSSPLGFHLHMDHPIIHDFFANLKCTYCFEAKKTEFDVNSEYKSYFINCLGSLTKKLLHCSEGIVFLMKYDLLEPALGNFLPQIVKDGELSTHLIINVVKFYRGNLIYKFK